jgi:glutathione S-transferase
MLTLRSSPASPFGRKVKIAAALLGLLDRIDIVVTDTIDPADAFTRENPLGKIPTLVLEDGATLFDSRVIVEYLDHLAGGAMLPTGEARFAALRLQALADGLLDAALLVVYESRFRPEEHRRPDWVARQEAKVARTLAAFGDDLPDDASSLHVGHVAQACALGYLDLRFAGTWRAEHPRLVAWLDRFSDRVPAFEATRFKG